MPIVLVILGLVSISSASAAPITVDGDGTDWNTLIFPYTLVRFTVNDTIGELIANETGTPVNINYASGFDIKNGSYYIDIFSSPGNISLYFKLVANGTIGDATGDGDAKNGTRDYPLDPTIKIVEGSPGVYDIGFTEFYQMIFDFNSDNISDESIVVGVADGVFWENTGLSTGLSAAWNNDTLEIGAVNVNIHDPRFLGIIGIDMYAGSGKDYWSEDRLPRLEKSPPEADFVFNPYCNGSADFLSTSDPGNNSILVQYNWSFGDNSYLNGTNPMPHHQYASGGTYTVTLFITNLWGLTDEISKSVTVGNGSVIADAGLDTIITEGECIVLGGSPTASGGDPPYTYMWEPNDGSLNDTDIPNPEACPTTNTTYRVWVNDSNNYIDKETCYGVDEVTITVLRPPAALGDRVWIDKNENGIQDVGEPGKGRVTVNLYDCNDNFVDSTLTDSSGYYLFDDLEPGNYYVIFIKPSGYEFTLQDQGGDDSKDSDADPSTGKTICTTLDPDETDLTWDAGLLSPPIPALSTIGSLMLACLLGIITIFGIMKRE